MVNPDLGIQAAAGAARPVGLGVARRGSGRSTGFSIDPWTQTASGGAGAAGQVGAATLGGLLDLQETDGTWRQDRKARRRGHDMLAALADLQRALTSDDHGGALDRLANLVAAMPPASDPGLAAVLAAISLRVRVELARRPQEAER